MEQIRHVKGSSDGWLRIKLEPGGNIVTVPEHLQVRVSGTTAGRDYFTVLEGVHRGRKASVTSGNLTTTRLVMPKGARLEFYKFAGVLTCGTASFRAITDVDNEIPKGEHPIQIPDFPHTGGQRYLNESRFAKTWFYLGHGTAVAGNVGRDRYLHTGSRSAGCVTVHPKDWSALYDLIIRCRSQDGRTVGTISVHD